jgi:hypothetical protein
MVFLSQTENLGWSLLLRHLQRIYRRRGVKSRVAAVNCLAFAPTSLASFAIALAWRIRDGVLWVLLMCSCLLVLPARGLRA